jgi:hypothetical protein
MSKEKKMTTTKNDKELEEHAFYESGLSSDSCLRKLDAYTIEAIERYGRILVQKQKENFIEGFQGSCYCCEPVGILNQKLEKIAKKLYGTVLHVYELAKVDPLVIIGPALYKEAAEGAKEYEEYNSHT